MPTTTARAGIIAIVVTITALAVIPFGTSVSAQEAGTISVGSGEAAVGEEAVVDLEALDMAAPGVGAWTIDVHYDPSVATAVGCLPQNGGVCNAGFADDTIRATGANANGLEGDSVLANITFRCDAEAETDLALTIQVLVDATVGDPQFIDAGVSEGTLTCGGAAPVAPTATPEETNGAMEPPDAGTGDFAGGDVGFFSLLVAGLIGAGLAWLIAGAAGARLAPVGGLRLPASWSRRAASGDASAAEERPRRPWFESARADVTNGRLPSVIRFRRVAGQDDR